MLIGEVQRIWLETRKTVIFVTHNVMEAVTLGDRVICMGARPGCIKQELNITLAPPAHGGGSRYRAFRAADHGESGGRDRENRP